MTDENPTPVSGTPLWQPSGTASPPAPLPYQTPAAEDQGAQTPYQPLAAQEPVTQAPHQPPFDQLPYHVGWARAPHQPLPPQPPYQQGAPYQSQPAYQQGAPLQSQPPYQQGAPYQSQPPYQQGAPYQSQPPYQQGFAPQQAPYPYQGPAQQFPYQPPVQQYAYPQGLVPGQAPDWVHAMPAQQYVPKPSALPIEPKRHSQFLQTPRWRWWKGPVALVVAAVAWLLASVIVVVPSMVYEIVNQHLSLTDPTALTNSLTKMTPSLFLANNLSVALMIPSAWLGLIIYGQRPRWLSSVVGGIRWGWLFRILGLILIPYIALEVLTEALGGLPSLSWKPYSLFMIIVILLTTPLQCAGEEFGLRGLVNRVFGSYGSSKISFWVGGVASSLLFAYLHLAQDIFLNIFYFSFGMLSCWMAWRTGGLEAGIAMHVVNNMFAMVVLPFSDFSGMMDRQAGSASAWDVLPLAAVMLASMGLVEWQVRRRKPVAVAAPGASQAEGLFVSAGLPQTQPSV